MSGQLKVKYHRYGYEQEPKYFATVQEVADFAYQGSVTQTVYVEYAEYGNGVVVRRHELMEMGEKRAATRNH